MIEDIRIPGLALYIELDPINGVPQPTNKVGVITAVSPSVTSETITVDDPEDGIPRTVDQTTTKIAERYSITTQNLNEANLALAHLSPPATAFVQTASGQGGVGHYAHNGHLVSLVDAGGANLYGVRSIAAVFKTAVDGTAAIITSGQAFFTGTKEIKIVGNHAATITVGKKFVVCGGGAVTDALVGVYTVVSSSHAANVTTVVVSETVAADLSNVGAGGLVVWGAAANLLVKDTDWTAEDLGAGTFKMKGAVGGSSPLPSSGATVFPCLALDPISGDRLLLPQNIASELEGWAWVFVNSDGGATQTVREARVSITPAGFATPRDQYGSLTFDLAVLTSNSAAYPAGRLLQILGDVKEGA